jgi:gliding motility-associated-like protein
VYDQEGVFSIVAVGRDVPLPGSVNCRLVYFPDTVDGLNQPINIRIFKYENIIAGDKRFICEGEELEITNTSDSNFTAFRYNVYLQPQDSLTDQLSVTGPATTGNPLVSRLTFPNRGNYNIVSTPTDFSANIPVEARPNCEVTDTIQVTVSATTAAFTIDSANFPKYLFTNTSENAVRYEWTIAKVSDPSNFLYNSPKLGNTSDPNWEVDLGNDIDQFIVCLKAISSDSLGACEDTTCQIVNNSFTTDIKVYNVFTPFGSPGSNDEFVVDIENEVAFEIKIFNRWGGKVFESTDKKISWNGKVNNDGSESPAGVYYYIINYQLKAQEPKSVNGTVTLIKD